MTWLYKGEPLTEKPEGYFGFVYHILHLGSREWYVGKKQFYSNRTLPPLKNKKRKRKKKIESDWKTYNSSSAELQNEIMSQGLVCFRKEILHLCKTKAEMSMLEAKEILSRDGLTDPNCWNKSLQLRIHQNQLEGVS